MLTITVSFMLFCNSSFSLVERLAVNLTSAMVNADIALSGMGQGSASMLKEERLRAYMDEEMEKEDDGSIVKGYNFIGWTLNEVLGRRDREGKRSDLWCGFGLKNLGFYSVELRALQRDHL
jgi:hypothetical protein